MSNNAWKELKRVATIKKKGLVRRVGNHFEGHFFEPEDDIISLCFTKGVDNCYDKQYDWHWELFLHKDGTWEIQ